MKQLHSQNSPPARIEVHVELIEQLFNSIDPSPFHARDMDIGADEYIVASARDIPKNRPLELFVHLDQTPSRPETLAQAEKAIQSHFAARAASTRLQLKEMFARGRISLIIGLFFLSSSLVLSEFGAAWLASGHMAQILRESVLIGGWVAMWRPMEIFFYDWWPVVARIRLFDRLSDVSVRIIMK